MVNTAGMRKMVTSPWSYGAHASVMAAEMAGNASRFCAFSNPLIRAVAWRKVMTLSLTIDHRVVDGAPGAEFLRTVSEFLGWPPGLQ